MSRLMSGVVLSNSLCFTIRLLCSWKPKSVISGYADLVSSMASSRRAANAWMCSPVFRMVFALALRTIDAGLGFM